LLQEFSIKVKKSDSFDLHMCLTHVKVVR
jgi:hypothetical protein